MKMSLLQFFLVDGDDLQSQHQQNLWVTSHTPPAAAAAAAAAALFQKVHCEAPSQFVCRLLLSHG